MPGTKVLWVSLRAAGNAGEASHTHQHLPVPAATAAPLLGTDRPGAKPDLNPASIQYTVVAPSAAPALGEPLAISVGRKGGAVPLFDTTGHR